MKAIVITAILLAAVWACPEARADFNVTCESAAGQTRNCPINGSYNRVYLKTQLSRAACHEGSSWGVADSYLWVSNGCRATFQVVQGNANPNSHGNRYGSHESSDNGKAAAAAAALIIGAAAIAASNKNKNHGRYSDSDFNNRYGNNYDNYGSGYNRDNYYGNTYGNNYNSRSITCESRNEGRNRCAAYIGRGNVEITRKLSSSDCRYGRDWDFDNNAIYVWNGCRAVFTVY